MKHRSWPWIAVLLALSGLVSACGGESASPSGSSGSSGEPGVSEPSDGSVGASPEVVVTNPDAAFEEIKLKGKGNKTVPFSIPEDAIGVATMGHPGSGKFEVTALDADGVATQTLVKTSGKYKGSVLFDLIEHSVAFKVAAKGAWTITVRPTESLKEWPGTATLKGRGDSVIRLADPSPPDARVALQSSGSSRFTVRTDAGDEDFLVVRKKGPYKGTITLPDATTVIEIRTKAAWSVKPVE